MKNDDEMLMNAMMVQNDPNNLVYGTGNNIYDLGCQESLYLYTSHQQEQKFQSHQEQMLLLIPRNGSIHGDETMVQLGMPSSFVNGTVMNGDGEGGMNESNRNKRNGMDDGEKKDGVMFNGCSTTIVPETMVTFINDTSPSSIHLNNASMDQESGSDHITNPWNGVVGDGLMSMEQGNNIHGHYVTNDGNNFGSKTIHDAQVYNYHLPAMVSTTDDHNVQFHDLDSLSFHSPLSMEDTSTSSKNGGGRVTVLVQSSRSAGTNLMSNYPMNHHMVFDHSSISHLQPSSSSLSSTSSLSSSTTTRRDCQMVPNTSTFTPSSFYLETIDTSSCPDGDRLRESSQLMNHNSKQEYFYVSSDGPTTENVLGPHSTIMKLLPSGSSVIASIVMNQRNEIYSQEQQSRGLPRGKSGFP